MDGFRALAQIDGDRCTLVSRNGNVCKSWPQLQEEIAHSVRAQSAILEMLPFTERKKRLRKIMPRVQSRLMMLDGIEARGEALFQAACERS